MHYGVRFSRFVPGLSHPNTFRRTQVAWLHASRVYSIVNEHTAFQPFCELRTDNNFLHDHRRLNHPYLQRRVHLVRSSGHACLSYVLTLRVCAPGAAVKLFAMGTMLLACGPFSGCCQSAIR